METTLSLGRYNDHKNKEFKIDSIFTMDDAHVVSGSEDGNIYFWSLEDVSTPLSVTRQLLKP